MNDSNSFILCEVDDKVATITLNRPDKHNAFTTPMAREWADMLERLESDERVRVIVVTGAGRSFCAGGDTQAMGADEVPRALDIRSKLTEGVHRIALQLQCMAKPVIAAINGAAMGAGLDLALMCDIRFAADTAVVGESYSRLGLVPGAGGSYFLPRIVGTAKALELLWTADVLDASSAERIGLVSRVLPSAQLLPATMEFAQRIASSPPLAVQAIKRLVHQSLRMDLASSLNLAASEMTLVRASDDHREAVAAMREKRSPSFRGC